MGRPGTTSALLAACVTSAAVQQCLSFTGSAVMPALSSHRAIHTRQPTSSTVRLPARGSSSSSSSTSSPSPDSRAEGSEIAGGSCQTRTRRQRKKARRKTQLFSTKERATSTPYLTSGMRDGDDAGTLQQREEDGASVPSWTTPQHLRAEVAARRAAAAAAAAAEVAAAADRGATFTPPSERFAEGRSKASAAADATAAAVRADAHARERQRELDMTSPPPDLMTTATTRLVGDDFSNSALSTHSAFSTPSSLDRPAKAAITSNSASKDDSSASEKGNAAEAEQGLGLWASRGLLAGAAMLYGTNFGCVKLLEETVPMSLAAFLRFSVAMIPFVPFLSKMNKDIFVAGAEIGLLNAIGYWAQSESLMTTTASKSAFICSLSVIMVPVIDVFFGAKKDAAKEDKADGMSAALKGPWLPALLALAGVACLELIGVEGGPNQGDVWALAQPICFGIGFWRTERVSRKFSGDTLGLVAAQLLTVAVLAGGWCVQAGNFPASIDSLRDVLFPASGSLAVPIALMWTGFMTTALTVFAETIAMQRVSASESTIILSTEPLWGTAFAAALLGERIGWNTGLGAMLIVSACTWTSVGPKLQKNLLGLIAATGAAGTVGETVLADVDVDDLSETVELVKDFVHDRL